jgi:hypothetical protein
MVDHDNINALFQSISEIAENLNIKSDPDQVMLDVGRIIRLADLGSQVTRYRDAAEKLDQVAAICERTSTDGYDRLDEIARIVNRV